MVLSVGVHRPWIPASAGMTVGVAGMTVGGRGNDGGSRGSDSDGDRGARHSRACWSSRKRGRESLPSHGRRPIAGPVIPEEAGIHIGQRRSQRRRRSGRHEITRSREQGRFTLWMVLSVGVHRPWIPASAGMTVGVAGMTVGGRGNDGGGRGSDSDGDRGARHSRACWSSRKRGRESLPSHGRRPIAGPVIPAEAGIHIGQRRSQRRRRASRHEITRSR